ncbi:glycosyltransferase family 2 protein [Thaumasiovibrio subtropicus]|uniref:glycosyltransferase family 2 protein n=1 Tax=Thaumasiovibrio subtropicus TaxID=1891207 RepID=UPI000B363AAD|nr:glycosyltransferase [Thaumasiovibrio subtropicus]
MINPTVTVVMPTYNCLETLPKAIDTVRMQGLELEILVIDDGSNDGSGEWLAEQADIKVIKTNRVGVSNARNLAIEAAKGELIAFLDADDYWHLDKFTHQLAMHRANPELVMSFTDYLFYIEGERTRLHCFQFWPRFHRWLKQVGSPMTYVFNDFMPDLYRENMVGTSTVLARRDALLAVGGFDASLKSASDWDLWLKLADYGPIGVVNEPLCDYTFGRVGAISGNHEKRAQAMKSILDKHAAAVWRNPICLLAGYQRWLSASADNMRFKKAYGGAVLRELAGFCLKPDIQTLKTVSGDTLKMLSLR